MEEKMWNTSAEKDRLRKEIRLRRKSIAQREGWMELCRAIQKRILLSACWKAAENIVLYIAVKGEPDTSLLLERAFACGKNVFLPRCRPGLEGEMDLIGCMSADDFRISPFGIPEPVLTPSSRILSPQEMLDEAATLVVTPALTFDRQGYRLGYGGGYYDRLFAGAACVSIGMAYSELLAPELPREPWDLPVDAVYTECGAFDNRKA